MKYAIILAGLLVVAGCAQQADSPTGNMVDDGTGDSMTGDSATAGSMQEPDVVFSLTGENFKFVMDGVDNPTLTVNQGDVVKIEFQSTSGFHDWMLDEFGAATDQVNAPDSTSVTFVADKAGTFEYYCSVGQHRAMGMWGNLIVQ